MRYRLPLLALALALCVAAWLRPGSALAHANLESADPAPGSAVPVAPARLKLRFVEPIQSRFSSIEVYDATRKRVDSRDFRVEGADSKGASVGLGRLPEGVYTVSWRNVSDADGHPWSGSYAFSVGDAPPPPATSSGPEPGPTVETPLALSALIRALNFVAMAVVVGAFGFRWLVWGPAMRAYGGAASPARRGRGEGTSGGDEEAAPPVSPPAVIGQSLVATAPRPLAAAPEAPLPIGTAPEVDAAVLFRTLAVARAGLAWLLLASVAAFALQAVAVSGEGLAAALGAPLAELLGTRYGVVWLARLGLIGALVAVLVAAHVRPRLGWPWRLGFLLGGGVLLTTSLVSHNAALAGPGPAWLRPALGALAGHAAHLIVPAVFVIAAVATIPALRERWIALAVALLGAATVLGAGLPVAADWLHLLAMSLWVGGLVQLALAAPAGLRRLEPDERPRFLRALVPAFTRLALVCVGALALTGVYTAVAQVRRLEALTGTAYGLTLLGKLALLLPLLGVGAANLLLGSERARRVARRAEGPILPPRFLRAVRLELVFVALILLATGLLTSLSPSKDTAAAEPEVGYAETRATDAGELSLTVDPATAGANSIRVRLRERGRAVSDASKVVARFSQPSRGVGESEVVGRPVGDGTYDVSGPHLGVPGEWRVEVIARQEGKDDARAVFEVPVSAPLVGESGGARVRLALSPRKPRAGEGTELTLTVTDRAGKPFRAALVSARLLMPQHAHIEEVELEDLGLGRYSATARLDMGGRWLAVVNVEPPASPPAIVNITFEVAEPGGER